MLKYILVFLATLVPSFAYAQLNVVVVFDGSGSMIETFSQDRSIRKITAAKNVLTQVLKDLSPDTKIGIITFSDNINGWAYPLSRIDKAGLYKAIHSIQAGGGTPLGSYMKQGADELLKLRQKQKYGIYKLIIVTDGESTDDCITPLTGQYGILSKGLLVEAIGVDMSATHTLATKISYRSANNPNELIKAVKTTLAEVSSTDSQEYDLIAPLDPKLALAALQALSEYDNAPVGTKPVVDQQGNIVLDKQGNVVYNVESSTSGGLIASLVILAVVGSIVIFVIVSIAKS